MDFGKVEDINPVDFTLPPDHPHTPVLLGSTAGTSARQVYIGPPIWANKEWVGKIYPATTKDKDFLYHYARQFNTIELNSTYYQIPGPDTVKKWKEMVPSGFRFCPKWPQAITHEAQLLGVTQLTRLFVESVLGFEENLGTTFLQLSPAFNPARLPTLVRFLKGLPQGFPVAIEFRHAAWFLDEYRWHRVLETLHELGAGTVLTDVAGRRDVLHMGLSSPVATLRFVGHELHPTDFTRTTAWVQRLRKWFEQGLQTAYIFIHCGENLLAPELTKYWIEQLNQQIGLSLEAPAIRQQPVQGSLF
ncbi:DUF72 domain-containing protein [Telluribacter sp.]|jgi:uncharacterized protein YecE (DUF72 family)|uniref:DUF72 domain-containing protein n=1 Tax=Telluribacter sp. TaxID=1978767 RepID=UPI002E138CF2|nr:DUF72 domain-containing protein [Telluribacter sp.]